jgi:hypothetical protein
MVGLLKGMLITGVENIYPKNNAGKLIKREIRHLSAPRPSGLMVEQNVTHLGNSHVPACFVEQVDGHRAEPCGRI